jgi:exopolysaccharide biosynthesis protein
MKKNWWQRLLLIIISIAFGCIANNKIIATSAQSPSQSEILYKSYILSKSIVRTLTIPNDNKFSISSASNAGLNTLENFARKHQAIAVINAGFFDPKNQKTTSYVFSKGRLIEDPRQNERLVNNPELQSQMKQILDRSEFRSYLCGKEYHYDIVLHSDRVPSSCKLFDVVGGGPQLLPKNTSQEEAFIVYEGNKVVKDALGSSQPNARSAVGMTKDKQVIFLMAAQRSDINSGMSFAEMVTFLKSLGVEKAMNLDGGSSASLYYRGETFHGKVDKDGNVVKRPVKSVLLVNIADRSNNS